MNRRNFLRSSFVAAILPIVDPDPDPARRAWFQRQKNYRNGPCCGEEKSGPNDNNPNHDGHPLNADQCRQVSPTRWGGDAESLARFKADPSYKGADLTVQWQVQIDMGRGPQWWDVENWQLVPPHIAEHYWQYIHGAAEVWYGKAWNQHTKQMEPNIWCLLPPMLV